MTLPFLKPVVPPHVFCLMADGVTYAFVNRKSPAGISFSQNFPYPPNTVGTGASGTPLFSAAALAPAVEAARRFSQGRLTRASVVFPDSWARILPVELDSIPSSDESIREMVLWKLKKLLPGVTTELEIVHVEMAPAGEQKRLLVAAAPAEMLRSIEAAFEEKGVRVGALAPASLVLFEGLAPTLSAKSPGDYALIHRSSGSIVFIIARGETLLLFRQRPSEEEEGHEQELRLSLSYYAEKLNGQGLAAIYVHDQSPAESWHAERLPVPPQRIQGRLFSTDPTFDERIVSRPELLPGFAAVYGR
ncbi:MAG TPA: hypothetical protein VKG01_17315 [Thermoanaerobaculia bacterium]|nr:hypothetical protein [Thermoanaerobaculia bacterium]